MNADTRNKNYSPDVEYITEDNKDLKQRWDECPKNGHHKEYVSIKTFQNNPWTNIADKYKALVQLPEFLGCMTSLTGMILVKQDDGTSTGSGFIHKIRRVSYGSCPCHICLQNKEVKKKVYAILTVTTVLHNFDENWDVALESGVFSENWEPKNTTVRLFYDSNDEAHEIFIYGYNLLETDKEINIHSDWCSVECVTHDMKLVQELETKLNKYMELQGEIYRKSKELSLNDLVIIVGHPHGGPKMISVGSPTKVEILKEVRNYQKWCRYEYDNITCHGNSGSQIFILGQPLCGFGYWFGHPHNHSKCFKVGSKEIKGGCSSVGVEHAVETD
ncbi:uncharacterized protein LOC106074523 isoform X2 [Biomphalaria glabrata]|nr:uncharacterized protein LOC106074523 isoform X2 [Biomphalaria glabrata]XP_055862108.1 uncharacterized protein LOC106074523 isoform X2 [Biomphalaria glabrata]